MYTATTEIYTYGHTLSLHDAVPSALRSERRNDCGVFYSGNARHGSDERDRGLTAAGHHVDVWRREMRQAVDGRNTERTERCRCQINDVLAAGAYYGVGPMVYIGRAWCWVSVCQYV